MATVSLAFRGIGDGEEAGVPVVHLLLSWTWWRMLRLVREPAPGLLPHRARSPDRHLRPQRAQPLPARGRPGAPGRSQPQPGQDRAQPGRQPFPPGRVPKPALFRRNGRLILLSPLEDSIWLQAEGVLQTQILLDPARNEASHKGCNYTFSHRHGEQ